jgi:predicted acetyltransferase
MAAGGNGTRTYEVLEPDEQLWAQYDEMAERAFGHRVGDITALRDVAVARVATRAGRVVAGGLGLVVDQHFGGRPVPGACLGAGCVAPEERGRRLADLLMAERLRAVRDRGAVVATLWTSSTGYVRRLGFEAPTPVHAWTVPTEDLRRLDGARVDLDGAYEVEVGDTDDGRALQRDLAAEWNGPVLRPDWWWSWKQGKSGLITYRFCRPGQLVEAVLTIEVSRRLPRGLHVIVHDLWAATTSATAAVLAFLGRHHSRTETIQFRRAALPPYPALLHRLPRFRLTSEAWHPWLLRILDLPRALRLRGWPPDAELELPLEVIGDDPPRTYLVRIAGGAAEAEPTAVAPAVRLTPGQLAVWYAGGYPSAIAARLSGVAADHPPSLTALVRATTAHQPWLPDLF